MLLLLLLLILQQVGYQGRALCSEANCADGLARCHHRCIFWRVRRTRFRCAQRCVEDVPVVEAGKYCDADVPFRWAGPPWCLVWLVEGVEGRGLVPAVCQ
jgi:hypothetical protein